MVKVKCRWCRKTVNDKPFFGTLHVCLDPHERDMVDEGLRCREEQRRVVAQYQRLNFGKLD